MSDYSFKILCSKTDRQTHTEVKERGRRETYNEREREEEI